MALRKYISPEESQKVRELAIRMSFEIMTSCGPVQTEMVDGKRKEHTTIFGFNSNKSRELIEDIIWKFLMGD